MYRIGELAKQTNLSIRALRYYDEIGLLKPAQVAESGYRYYSEAEIKRLQHISALKELGFTLASIKEMLGSGSGFEAAQWESYLQLELAAIRNERKRLDEMERLLLNARYAYEMKGEIDPEDIFLFIRALNVTPEMRDRFLTRNFTEQESEIIKGLPDLGDNDERNLAWAKLIRQIRERLHEPPESPESQQLAGEILELAMEWFGHDEQLIEKYWDNIRPEQGEEARVYGMDTDVMDYIDRMVDWYLQHSGEDGLDDGGKENN